MRLVIVVLIALAGMVSSPAAAQWTRGVPIGDWAVDLAECDASLVFRNEGQGGDVGIYIKARGRKLTMAFGSHTFTSLRNGDVPQMRISYGTRTSIRGGWGVPMRAIVTQGEPTMLSVDFPFDYKDEILGTLSRNPGAIYLNRDADGRWENQMVLLLPDGSRDVFTTLRACG